MKNKKLLQLFILSLLLVPFFVHGQLNRNIFVNYFTNISPGDTIYAMIISLVNWFFSFLIALAVVGMVASGIMFVFAGGDPGKVKTAKNMAIYSLIGVLVGSLGWILVNWVRGFF